MEAGAAVRRYGRQGRLPSVRWRARDFIRIEAISEVAQNFRALAQVAFRRASHARCQKARQPSLARQFELSGKSGAPELFPTLCRRQRRPRHIVLRSSCATVPGFALSCRRRLRPAPHIQDCMIATPSCRCSIVRLARKVSGNRHRQAIACTSGLLKLRRLLLQDRPYRRMAAMDDGSTIAEDTLAQSCDERSDAVRIGAIGNGSGRPDWAPLSGATEKSAIWSSPSTSLR